MNGSDWSDNMYCTYLPVFTLSISSRKKKSHVFTIGMWWNVHMHLYTSTTWTYLNACMCVFTNYRWKIKDKEKRLVSGWFKLRQLSAWSSEVDPLEIWLGTSKMGTAVNRIIRDGDPIFQMILELCNYSEPKQFSRRSQIWVQPKDRILYSPTILLFRGRIYD